MLFKRPPDVVQCASYRPHLSTIMWTILSVSTLTLAAILVSSQSDAAPAEGLTPFGFLMARAYGEPDVHPVMRFIAFKPSDGAKFRETFEKKHGPRGRDLIDSLGRGSYKNLAEDQKAEFAIVVGEASSGKSSAIKNPSESYRSKKLFEQST